MEGSSGIWGGVLDANGVTCMQLDRDFSESLGGSTRIPKTENSSRGGNPEVVVIYKRRIGGVLRSLTTFVQLKSPVSLSRDPGESSSQLDASDEVDDKGEGEDGGGLLNKIRYSRKSARSKLMLASR